MYRGHRKYQSEADPNILRGGLTPTPERRHNQIAESVDVLNSKKSANDASRKNPRQSQNKSNPHMTLPGPVQLPRWETTPGLQGICNHGNTCFMNTIFQCLSNTDLFAEYFVLKKFKESQSKSLTKKLVGSSKPEICEEIGRLLESLWAGTYVADISSHLKSVVSKHNVQYKGSSQHDAQEFFLWLLDKVNEELHFSAKKKLKDAPSKAKKEKQNEVIAQSSPESVLASCSGFEVYNRFQALYKSSLKCPVCKKPSNTYESYLCLSLPVPQKNTRSVFLTIVYLDELPLKIALEMNIADTIKDLRDKLSLELDVLPIRLVLCQVTELGFGNTYGDDQPLSDIHESEVVYVFETFPLCEVNKTPDLDLIQILLVHVEKISPTKCYRFCNPVVIKVSRDIDYSRVQRYILKSMKLAVSEHTVDRHYTGAIFDVRIVDSGARDVYLATNVDMPLYTEPIDRALNTYSEDYGPAHIKFVVEWDPDTKRKLVLDDEMSVEEHPSVHKARLSQDQPSIVSLEECLQLFTKEEKLEEGEAWQCPNCEKSQEGATKKLGLWSAPDILVLHLKRFRHCGSKRNKLNTLVSFPVNDLEMGHHLLPADSHADTTSDLYDLYAVSNHYGNLSGGHYTAFCRNLVDMKWYEFDDTTVKPLHKRDIVSRAAYLLFYQRKKLTNNTINSLHTKEHWVYTINGPPRGVQTFSSSPLEESKPVVKLTDSSERDRIHRDIDYSDYYVDRVKLDDVDNRYRNSESVREKSPPVTDRMESLRLQEEERLMEQLRQGINSPKMEHHNTRPTEVGSFALDVYTPMKVNLDAVSPRQGHNVASPRQEDIGVNSPRQLVKQTFRESPRRELFTNTDHMNVSDRTYSSERQYFEAALAKSKPTVAERILHSQMSSFTDQTDSGTLSPRNPSSVYRRSDSVDSSRNSHSYTSGSEISPSGSAPPSPLDEYKQNSASNKAGSVLNNERDTILNGNIASGTKLKIHSNQIHDKNVSPRPSSDGIKNLIGVPPKSSNQKVNNSSNMDKTRVDVYSTPQQTRKSPSPPGKVWSTPQPSRKLSDIGRRPSVDRQLSVPSKNVEKQSYLNQELSVEGHAMLDSQPRSLPMEIRRSADKPPLPTKPSRPSSGATSSQGRVIANRPATAHVGMSDYNSSTPVHTVSTQPYGSYSSSENRPIVVADSQPVVTNNRDSSYSDSRPIIVGERIENQSRSRRDRRRADEDEVRRRNRSADRLGRGSVRTRTERPVSYHQTLEDNDFLDQYYLAQPYEDVKTFERSSRYATMQPQRYDQQVRQFNDDDYLQRQFTEPRIIDTVPQSRSRLPLSAYNPQLYQDTGYEHPHYQPHLHHAKILSKLALRENELMRRRKAEYLKESSV